MNLDLEKLADRYGVPFVALVLVAFGLWMVLRWLRPRADQLIDSHLLLIQTLREEAPKQTQALQQLVQGMGELRTASQQTAQSMAAHHNWAVTAVEERLALRPQTARGGT